jgi:hypothetical protein
VVPGIEPRTLHLLENVLPLESHFQLFLNFT